MKNQTRIMLWVTALLLVVAGCFTYFYHKATEVGISNKDIEILHCKPEEIVEYNVSDKDGEYILKKEKDNWIIKNQDIFWAFFSLNVVALLLSYAMLFPAFLALRKSDPQTARPFKVPGGKVVIQLMAWIPEVLLIVTVILTVVPMNASSSEISGKLPVMIGTIITLVIGEIVVRTTEYRANKIGEIDHENIK